MCIKRYITHLHNRQTKWEITSGSGGAHHSVMRKSYKWKEGREKNFYFIWITICMYEWYTSRERWNWIPYNIRVMWRSQKKQHFSLSWTEPDIKRHQRQKFRTFLSCFLFFWNFWSLPSFNPRMMNTTFHEIHDDSQWGVTTTNYSYNLCMVYLDVIISILNLLVSGA